MGFLRSPRLSPTPSTLFAFLTKLSNPRDLRCHEIPLLTFDLCGGFEQSLQRKGVDDMFCLEPCPPAHCDTIGYVVQFSDIVGVRIDYQRYPFFHRLPGPILVEVQPLGLAIYLEPLAVFLGGLDHSQEVDGIALPPPDESVRGVTEEVDRRMRQCSDSPLGQFLRVLAKA